jgi:hypothetical protein
MFCTKLKPLTNILTKNKFILNKNHCYNFIKFKMTNTNEESFRKLNVFKYSSNFDEAVKIVTQPLVEPLNNEILVKNIYVGVNATDLNITAGRYFAHEEPPYPLGIEV